jgi:Cof subfamily protein (haloacid dehalogenase superfamily)
MQYRLLALDLDGTLLQRDGSVHPRDLAAIARVRKQGVAVTICTGRLYSGSRHVAELLNMEGPMGCVDGSQVMLHASAANSPLELTAIQGGHALQLRELLGRRDSARFFVAGDRIVHDAAGTPYAPFVATWTGVLEETGDLHGHGFWSDPSGVLAAIVVGKLTDIEATAADIRAELGGHAHLISFPLHRLEGMGGMVVRAPGRSKGTALRTIGAHYDIGVEQMVAVGDWLNDKPMFEVAGRSFAMKTAPEEVRALATDQVECALADGGVAEVIERVFG